MPVVKTSPLPAEALAGDPPISPAPPRPNRRLRLFFLVSLILFLCGGQALAADKIVVLYPEAPEPYRGVFSGIIDGMRSRGGADFIPHSLPKDYDPQALDRTLRTERAGGIVFLGKRGYHASKKLGAELPTIFGALRAAPEGFSGISLSADPGL